MLARLRRSALGGLRCRLQRRRNAAARASAPPAAPDATPEAARLAREAEVEQLLATGIRDSENEGPGEFDEFLQDSELEDGEWGVCFETPPPERGDEPDPIALSDWAADVQTLCRNPESFMVWDGPEPARSDEDVTDIAASDSAAPGAAAERTWGQTSSSHETKALSDSGGYANDDGAGDSGMNDLFTDYDAATGAPRTSESDVELRASPSADAEDADTFEDSDDLYETESSGDEDWEADSDPDTTEYALYESDPEESDVELNYNSDNADKVDDEDRIVTTSDHFAWAAAWLSHVPVEEMQDRDGQVRASERVCDLQLVRLRVLMVLLDVCNMLQVTTS